MRKSLKSKILTNLTINKFQESISAKNKTKTKLNMNKKEENKALSSSPSSSKRITSSRILLNQNSQRDDKVEKKLYLENINMRNHINVDLLSKLSSTFKTFNFQSHGNDPKIESNLFNIGSKRSLLLRRSMTTVRNMIQDFDNQFSINLDIKNQKPKISGNILCNKYKTKQIKEESYSDFDFNLNKTNNENNNEESKENNNQNNQMLINNKNFFQEMKKGNTYLKNEESIETKLQNEKKIMGLKNAFKYYELLYNYKYFITEKDILCLSFNRRKKMEKKALEKYMKTPKIKYDIFDEKYEKCKKCDKNKKIDKFKYNNNLKIHLLKKNLSDLDKGKTDNNKLFKTELKNIKGYNSKKILKRALSGYNSISSKKNSLYNNSNSKYNLANTRPTTTASTKNFQKFNKKINLNSLTSSKNNDLNLSNISSISNINNPPATIQNPKEQSNSLSIKRKIRDLSENIFANSNKIKTGLEETYQNIMQKLEEESKPVKKVKKKMLIDIDKIRTDLNLKRRGEGINEIKMIMDNVDKLYKSLPKSHVELMRSIAKIVINEERRKNKPLIYNDTYDNKLFKKRYKKEMFEASCKMKEIRKSLNKNKIEKPFEEKLRHLLKNDVFVFFNIKSLKEEMDKIRVLRGEIIKN